MSARDEELAREWFEKADHDWMAIDALLAVAAISGDIICFHCHQVADKFLKGFLTWHATVFSKTHNLMELLSVCTAIDAGLAVLAAPTLTLNAYAVDVRYPGMAHSNPSRQEAVGAREAAREIRTASRQRRGRPAGSRCGLP